MNRVSWPLWIAVLTVSLWAALSVYGAVDGVGRQRDQEWQARQIARQLACPVCRGQSVAESNSPVAVEIRQDIRRQLAEGRTPEQILQYYVDRYGEQILFSPPMRGPFWLVYLTPFLAIPGIALIAQRALRVRRALWAETAGGREEFEPDASTLKAAADAKGSEADGSDASTGRPLPQAVASRLARYL